MKLKKIVIWILTTTLLLNSACTSQEQSVEPEKTLTAVPKVEITEIWNFEAKAFSVMWEVFPEKESIIRSKSVSDVIEIYVGVWDKVKKWQLLAILQSDQVTQNYNNALSLYNKTISSANRTINSAQVSLNNSQTLLEKTIITSNAQKNEASQGLSQTKTSIKLSISQAKQNLENIIENSERKQEVSETNLANALNFSKIAIEDSLSKIDKILWIEEVDKEGALKYDDYLWNLDPSKLITAQSNYRKAKNQSDITNYSDNKSVLLTLWLVKKSAQANIDLLENSWSGPSFTALELQNLIQSTNWISNSIQLSINSVSGSQNALNSTVTWNKTSIESAEKALALAKMEDWDGSQVIKSAEKTYDRNIASIDSSIEVSKNQINSAQANLESAKWSASLSISNAKSALNNAQVALDNLKIIAGFNWEVSNIYVEKWDEVSMGSSIISIWDNTKFKIITYLTKNQNKWLSEWDDVLIWTKSHDTIKSISSIADLSNKKYKLEIIHQNPFLQSWEFIKLSFVPKKEIIWTADEVFLPLPAVYVTENWNFVWLVKNWVVEKAQIKTWELSWNSVKVLEWLNIWDNVIIKWWRFLKKDGQKVEIIEK